jgi:hypothetical protein
MEQSEESVEVDEVIRQHDDLLVLVKYGAFADFRVVRVSK